MTYYVGYYVSLSVWNSKYYIWTGAGLGLSLILNLEQYEYMNGPQNDAGIKVSLSYIRGPPFNLNGGGGGGGFGWSFFAAKFFISTRLGSALKI